MKASFDRIICDPPFLSEDCQTKGLSNIDKQCPTSKLTPSSCTDCTMASEIVDTGVSASHCMYWRAYGESGDHQTVW
jgi:hypothetical protein